MSERCRWSRTWLPTKVIGPLIGRSGRLPRFCGQNLRADAAATTLKVGKFVLASNEAAHYLTLSPRTLERWCWEGGGPSFAKLRGNVVYTIEGLLRQPAQIHHEEARVGWSYPGTEKVVQILQKKIECV